MVTPFQVPTDPALQHEDAILMLLSDHEQVRAWLADFRQLPHDRNPGRKAAIVKRICDLLTIHVQLEEELFYPTARHATGDDGMVDVALVEQAASKALVAQLADADPTDPSYDAKVTVLCEQLEHHTQEEETRMFPKVRAAGVDTAALGKKMLLRRSSLLEKMGLADYDHPLT